MWIGNAMVLSCLIEILFAVGDFMDLEEYKANSCLF